MAGTNPAHNPTGPGAPERARVPVPPTDLIGSSADAPHAAAIAATKGDVNQTATKPLAGNTIGSAQIGAANYASVTDANVSSRFKKFSWADLVEEDLASEVRDVLRSEELLASLRRRKAAGDDPRVIIPGNLETEFPYMYKRMKAAAVLTKTELVPDYTRKITLMYSDVFSPDAVKRENALSAIERSVGGEVTMRRVSNLTAMAEAICEMPSAEALKMQGRGKLGLFYICQTIAQVYSERTLNVPIAQQKAWWRYEGDLRDEVSKEVEPILGDSNAARTLTIGVEILYRKFLRRILDDENLRSKFANVEKEIRNMTHLLAAKGVSMMRRHMRVETSKRTVKTADSKNKSKMVEVVATQQRVVPPHVREGPSTLTEKMVNSNINQAFADLLLEFPDLVIHPTQNPRTWSEEGGAMVQEMYRLAEPFNRLETARRKEIRQVINERRKLAASAKPGKASNANKADIATEISAAEWQSEAAAYVAANSERMDKELKELLALTFSELRTLASGPEEMSISLVKREVRQRVVRALPGVLKLASAA